MAVFSLSAYTLRVRHKREQDFLKLDSCGNGLDLLDAIESCLQNIANISHNTDREKLIRVSQLTRADRSLTGVMETGDYGFERDLRDITSGSQSYRRQSTDAEMIPFYFLISIPTGRDEGIVILQRFHQYGVRTLLQDEFTKYFGTLHPDLFVILNPIVARDYIKRYLKDGRLTKLRFRKFTLPKDIADYYVNQDHIESEAYVEYSIVAKRNRSLPMISKVRQVLSGDADMKGIIEIHGLEYDTVLAEVELGTNRRTVDLSQLGRLRSYYDITDKVQVDQSGHPAFASIDAASRGLLADISAAIRA